jgi:hypothetical protein
MYFGLITLIEKTIRPSEVEHCFGFENLSNFLTPLIGLFITKDIVAVTKGSKIFKSFAYYLAIATSLRTFTGVSRCPFTISLYSFNYKAKLG